jgi:hypothetical protein
MSFVKQTLEEWTEMFINYKEFTRLIFFSFQWLDSPLGA